MVEGALTSTGIVSVCKQGVNIFQNITKTLGVGTEIAAESVSIGIRIFGVASIGIGAAIGISLS